MVTGIAATLFDFQEQAVIQLIDLCTDSRSKQTIVMKAPTGSGKTIMLIDFVDEYLNKVNSNAAFIWLCPGKGDLEEQSRQKMRKFAPPCFRFTSEAITRTFPGYLPSYSLSTFNESSVDLSSTAIIS